MSRDALIRSNLAFLGLGDKPELYKEFTGFSVETVVAHELETRGDIEEVSRVTQHVVCETTPRVPLNIKGTGFTLYPPQAGLIRVMLQIENEHSWVQTPKIHELDPTRYSPEYQTNVGMVLERMSFGKSTLIPALVRYQPTCEWRMRTTPGLGLKGTFAVRDDVPYQYVLDGVNVIVAARVTLEDWERRLRRTDIKYFTIKSAEGLTKCASALLSNYTGETIIIVVRSGSMSYRGRNDLVLNHFTIMTNPYAFARVFYDDFDMLELMGRKKDVALMPKARFHWLFSATANPEQLMSGEHQGGFGTFDWLRTMPGAYIKAFFSTRCSTNFSQLEFNVPPIRWFSCPDETAELVARIVLDHPIDASEFHRKSSSFVTSVKSVPYNRSVHGCKVLVSVESKSEQQKLVAGLKNRGIPVVLLDRRNVHLFGEDAHKENVVGVSRLIHGISMGYLTHVVIHERGYRPEEIDQVVGRAQRLGRKHDLQVFTVPVPFDAGYTAGLAAVPTLAARPATGDSEFWRGYEEAMHERGYAASSGSVLVDAPDPAYERGFFELQASNKGYADGFAGISPITSLFEVFGMDVSNILHRLTIHEQEYLGYYFAAYEDGREDKP